MADRFAAPDYGVLAALVVFVVASIALAVYAQRATQKGSFLSSYFLGNRGLGAWALALTATVQSGGTFMGYPALVYSHGWIVGLWIASYMVVPITGFGLLAKRLAQLSRRSGAITVPDLFRERFDSPAAGVVSSLLIIVFMTFMMVAQFKAGASIMKVVWPNAAVAVDAADGTAPATDLKAEATSKSATTGGLSHDQFLFYLGLVLFTITVVGYTMVGGFLAAVWTDLFQSVLMWLGVMLLLGLSMYQLGGIGNLTPGAVAQTSPQFAYGPGYSTDGRQFLTPGLAFSVFFVWVFGGLGQPASLVRLMACKDTQTIRRSVLLLAVYNSMIYLPLIFICMAARAAMPTVPVADEVIPRMALWTTRDLPGGSLLAGLILVAPFGAVMATVSSYLIVIASGLVHDVYQRFINPKATERQLQSWTYAVMVLVGIVAIVANLKPVAYLQAIVVFCGSSCASSFAVPALMTAFWRRATAPGVIAAMLAGAGMSLTLLVLGSLCMDDQMLGPKTNFRSYYLLGLEPIVWGLLASAITGVVVCLCTRPPSAKRIAWLFDAA